MTCEFNPCPFCGKEAVCHLTDAEGNLRPESYLNDPWSGVGYVLFHPVAWDSCPIATEIDMDDTLGMQIYSSMEEAARLWNKRG